MCMRICMCLHYCRYSSVNNKRVADFLYEQLASQHDGAYTPRTIKRRHIYTNRVGYAADPCI